MIDRLKIDRRSYADERPSDEQIMNLKFLKIYRKKDNFEPDSDKLYSLGEILEKKN